MSIVRLKSRVKNNDVFFQNRLANFTNPPVLTGDLYVEKNESVNGNLDISGNLTVGNNLRANNFYATGNYYLNNYVLHRPERKMRQKRIKNKLLNFI